ncbi:TPA: VOC family protein [Burkholderia multivorans]|uniref:VOC family protein n=1 Tax=Burkholderia multivorans TaxID=87883 RepID=UPI000D009C72|nr:VOC family protein [Burkholderia multivorans]MBU9298431.1 VOC family protein [Burkholderia multivorans]MBU9306030.1 VOC family protein [Burkholderia multivorans]MBU9407577.1 VOC family protein [Burkholderia multivorans]MBU9503354.1 VOC family protein [Burkholderia multivorans]MBU9509295.1 VOC family protein [Burkholderia multivorans]
MTSATATATAPANTAATAAPDRAIAWFDIPSLDFDRAIRFYEAVLQTTLHREVIGGVPMAIFDHEASSTGGSIVFDPQQLKPSANGVLVYLNAGESVVAALDRAKRAGGVVQGSVVELPNNYGYIGYLIDTEGNRVGLHAPKCH